MRRSWTAFALLAVAVAGSLQTGHQMFLHLTYLLLALIVVSFLWAWLGIEWVTLSRKVEARGLQVGEVAREKLILRNKGLLPKLWLEVRDHSDLPGHGASRVVNSLWPRSAFGWEARTFCRKRGKFTLGPASLASGDPFGIFRLERRLNETVDFFVFPATLELDGISPDIGVLPGGEAHWRLSQHITTSASSIRGYVFGDSFNRIHWPSTARLGEVMVKEFDLEPMGKVWLFLDMQAEVQAGLEPGEERIAWEKGDHPYLPPNTVEYGVTIAASLVKRFLGEGMAVGLVSYGQARHVVPLDRGSRQYIRLMEILAMVRAEGGTPFAESIIAEKGRLGPDTFAIAISPSPQPAWIGALEGLTPRGVRAAAIVLDAGSFPGPQTAVQAHDALLAPQAVNMPIYKVRCGDHLELLFNRRRPKAKFVR